MSIRVKVEGTDRKEVLTGTVGMTIDVRRVEDYWMDGGYAGCHYEAFYIVSGESTPRSVIVEWNDATVDIDLEVYKKWVNDFRKPAFVKIALEKHHKDCAEIEKGKEVVVMRGHKVPIGTKGVVFWTGIKNFDPYGRSFGERLRVGIKDADGNVYWTDASNCDVLDPTVYYEDEEVIKDTEEKVEKESLLWLNDRLLKEER